MRAALLRPTLARRVVLALLAAGAVVWIVLMVYYYVRVSGRHADESAQRTRGDIISAALANIGEVEPARAAIALYSDFFNASLRREGTPERFLLQLEDGHGNRLYVSPESGGAHLRGEAGRLTLQSVGGKQYRVFRSDSARWRVLLGEPAVSATVLVASLSSDLTMSVLISLPFILLPSWLAVAGGLRPLRRLSATLAARGPDDLSPLGLDAIYAELEPVVAAIDGLLDQLRRKVEREGTFVQDAAHELRTPLALIAAQAHVLALAPGQAERLHASARLEQAIARASHLIGQLLELARLDKLPHADWRMLDVAAMVRAQLAACAQDAIAGDIELSLDAPDSLVHALEPHAFESIVQNLVGNALRYSHPGAHVDLTLSMHDAALQLVVADDGPGIPESERALVFERFHRGAGNDASGSGLGLAIVTQAVARLHGTVRLEPAPSGTGCRFIVLLAPAAPISQGEQR
ncbi:MAG: ATP-binding protein [Pseudomonadota bacterium]